MSTEQKTEIEARTPEQVAEKIWKQWEAVPHAAVTSGHAKEWWIAHITTALTAKDAEIERLEKAIRKHRDQRGDDRCWLDDEELHQTLPEGYTAPKREVRVELENCRRFIQCRQNLKTIYVSPQRELEAKDVEIERITDRVDLLVDEFKRIRALDFDSEINALCERAITQTMQIVPVIEQRDKLESRNKAQTALLVEACQALKPFSERFDNFVAGLAVAGESYENSMATIPFTFTAGEIRAATAFLALPEVAALMVGGSQ